MQFSLSWIREYIDLPETPQQIAAMFTELGIEVEEMSPEATGECHFKVGLTPNLTHCHSVRGLARELAAYTGRPLQSPFTLPPLPTESAHPLRITLSDHHDCSQFYVARIEGLNVTASPTWMQNKLFSAGLRPINLVVDITQLAMLEVGQPLHAYDGNRVQASEIVVRRGRDGESLTALNAILYPPTHETLLVCDGEQPIALAGVMGSMDTAVTEATSSVILESAYFSPPVIRRSRKQLGVMSEASHRFERGVDPLAVREGWQLALHWLLTYGQGRLVATQSVETPFVPHQIILRLSQINKVLGIVLPTDEVLNILQRLDMQVTPLESMQLRITVPSYRNDILSEIDCIEEVARLYGYNHLKSYPSAPVALSRRSDDNHFVLHQQMRSTLQGLGLHEFVTCDLISEREARLVDFARRQPIHLLNPLSLDQALLRPSLLPSLMQVVRHNRDHGAESITGYEIGTIYFRVKDTLHEQHVVAMVLAGQCERHDWQMPKGKPVDFFTLKGLVEESLAQWQVAPASFVASQHGALHPGRQAALLLNGQESGVLGEVHPQVLSAFDLKGPIYYAELSSASLMQHRLPSTRMHPLPLYPSSTRDWTVALPMTLPVADVLAALTASSHPLLEQASVHDLYQDPSIAAGGRRLTLRFVYRDLNKTIAQHEVDAAHAAIMQTLNEKISL